MRRRLPLIPALMGGVLSGLLYWAAFPGVDLWPLTFVAFVPLYISTLGQTPKHALLIGLTTGLVVNVTGFSWLLGMLRTFSGFSTPLCLLFMIVISVAQGLRFGLQTWLFARGQLRGWPRPLLFLLCFVASEQLFPLLFDFYYGATVHRVPTLMQTADLGGPITVGTLLLLINLTLAEPIVARWEARPVSRPFVAIGAAAAIAMVVYGRVRIAQVDERVQASEPVRVGVVQANMGLKEKRVDVAGGLFRHFQQTDDLRARGAELVVWSETSVMQPVTTQFYRDQLERMVGRRLGVPAILGAVLLEKVPDARGFTFFNTALSVDARGAITGRYDKTYLLQFGESLPFASLLPFVYKWSPNSGKFTAGTSLEPLVVQVNGAPRRIAAFICYEDILPGFVNRLVRAGDPDLLVNLTNDAWFGDTSEPWEHVALAKLRAVEHRRFLVRGTNSGISAFVDPVGRVVDQTGLFTRESKITTVRWMRGRTIYEIAQDFPWYALSALGILAAFLSRRRFGGRVETA